MAYSAGTGQDFDVENLNSQNGDPSGTHLRFNNPIGGTLVFSLPTTGYENAIVNFSTKRSGSGAGQQTWSYSTDGVAYTVFQTINPNDANPTLQTLNFADIPASDNNPNFKLKVEFAQGTGGTVGNNRFDNFTIQGFLPGTVPVVTPKISYASNFVVVDENVGTLNFALNIENANTGSFDLVVKESPFSTANAADFTLLTQTITITPESGTFYNVSIPIVDDTLESNMLNILF